ncbi:MAG: gamma-glutamyl-gamma-aminobutyrate hydrolase family protein [bacterium]|nr:gamma-glutamyl-gamma-aminobutyrate hydrolase family protein [bacterium]
MHPESRLPLILVTTKQGSVPHRYVDAVRLAGGDPIVVGPGDPLPGAFDGLLLSGGEDVHPRHYGQEIAAPVQETLKIDEARDLMELDLAHAALRADLPVLCICRGAQLMNVAAGGTLWQDLSLAGIPSSAHYQSGGDFWETSHEVVVEPGSRLAAILGAGPLPVNSYHHQAVAEAASGFAITSRAPDGTIESLEGRRHRWVMAIQWHPERLVRHHPVQLRLFTRFVEEARRS